MDQAMGVQPVILIVEDEDVVRSLIVELFVHVGFEVLEAPDGAAAVTVLKARPDIGALLTDVHMPGVPDGLALAKYARALRPRCAILIASALAEPRAGELDSGTCFIRKPYRGSQAVQLIKGLLAHSPHSGHPGLGAASTVTPAVSSATGDDGLDWPGQAVTGTYGSAINRFFRLAERCRHHAAQANHRIVADSYWRVARSYDLLARLAPSEMPAAKMQAPQGYRELHRGCIAG